MLGVWVNISVGEAAAYGEAVMPGQSPAAVKLDLAIPLGALLPIHAVEVRVAVGLAIRGESGSPPSIPVLIGVLAGSGSVPTCTTLSNAVVVTAAIAFGIPSDVSTPKTALVSPALLDTLGLDQVALRFSTSLMQFAVLSAHEAQSAVFNFSVKV